MMKDLIEKLEAAKVGSRELDAEIGAWLSEHRGEGPKGLHSNYILSQQRTWRGTSGYVWLEWTTNLQTALSLVPEGWRVYAIQQLEFFKDEWFAGLDTVPHIGSMTGKAPTPALALCIAALKTRE